MNRICGVPEIRSQVSLVASDSRQTERDGSLRGYQTRAISLCVTSSRTERIGVHFSTEREDMSERSDDAQRVYHPHGKTENSVFRL